MRHLYKIVVQNHNGSFGRIVSNEPIVSTNEGVVVIVVEEPDIIKDKCTVLPEPSSKNNECVPIAPKKQCLVAWLIDCTDSEIGSLKLIGIPELIVLTGKTNPSNCVDFNGQIPHHKCSVGLSIVTGEIGEFSQGQLEDQLVLGVEAGAVGLCLSVNVTISLFLIFVNEEC